MRRPISKLLIRPWLLLAVAALLGAGFLGGGLVARATNDFTDVPTGAFYHDAVSFLKAKGITAGCGAGIYCPNDNVTRGEMAVFLQRMAGDGAPPSVDADKLDGIDSSAFGLSSQVPGYNYNNNGAPNTLITLTGSGQSMTSVTLDAPASGFAVVTARAEVFITHTNGTQDNVICKVSTTSGDISTPSFGIGLVRIPSAYPTASSSVDTVEVTRVFSASAGPNTFHLNCYENFGSGGDSILAPEITAVFMPSRYGTGAAPAAVTISSQGRDVARD